ncbi:hypothetical protein V8J36_05415 [Frigidibacter sp. MR17.14]|uniref:hypothetical protein n=1 Tax=Frigidibacter sp. MR17.14 TaxID=3126509 RepID=UPI0030130DAF
MEQRLIPLSAGDICDLLGRKEIASRVGRGPTAVSNAAVLGAFPASWYVIIRDMCAEQGVACPEEIFSFLPGEPPRNIEGDAA